MRNLILAGLACSCFVGTALGDQCKIERLPTEGNGIYYSVSGLEADATRVKLKSLKDSKVQATWKFEGIANLKYSPRGRFFVRSGVNRDDWLQLKAHLDTDNAILIRRMSEGDLGGQNADHIRVFRSHLDESVCPSVKAQLGTSNAGAFVQKVEYQDFHKSEGDFKKSGYLAQNFHFVFKGRDLRKCKSTLSVKVRSGFDARGDAIYSKSPVNDFYNVNPTEALRSKAAVYAGVFVSPAYASNKVNFASVDVSLHHRRKNKEYCVSFAAPIPSINLNTFFQNIFDSDPVPRAINWSQKNGWRPDVTHIDFNTVVDTSRLSYIRIGWK